MTKGKPKACLFCGRTGVQITIEDVIPKWIHRAFVQRFGSSMSSMKLLDRETFDLLRTMPRGFDVRLRAVCIECNNGWMHDLEGAFRSVMLPAVTGDTFQRNEPIRLDERAQRVVSVWAAKTILLMQLSVAHFANAKFDSNGPEILYETGAPPENWFVFIGRVMPDLLPDGSSQLMVNRKTIHRVPSIGETAMAFALTIGPLAFYLSVPGDGGLFMNPGGVIGTSFRQIWPNKFTEVGWPPARILSSADLDTLFPIGGIQVWDSLPSAGGQRIIPERPFG